MVLTYLVRPCKDSEQEVTRTVVTLVTYPAPMYPDVTTASPGPRNKHVKLYRLSRPVWTKSLNCTTTMLVMVSPYCRNTANIAGTFCSVLNMYCFHNSLWWYYDIDWTLLMIRKITPVVFWVMITCSMVDDYNRLIDWHWVRALMVPMHPGLIDWPFVPHNLISAQDSPVPLPKFQMAPRLNILMSSGSCTVSQLWTNKLPPSSGFISEDRGIKPLNISFRYFFN